MIDLPASGNTDTAVIGPEPGSASADYIPLYRGDAKLLQESLEAVQRTATVIVGAITPELAGPAGSEDNIRRRSSENRIEVSVRAHLHFLMEFDTASKGLEELGWSCR